MAKQPTPQGVSALLRKAGHTRSEASRSGMIRGWTESSEGYRVQKYGSEIKVQHLTGISRGPAAAQRAKEKLSLYADVISAAGFAVRETTFGVAEMPALIVSAPEEASDG